MIRVIYNWNVVPEKLELFIETWKRTTNKIHKEVKGARGSFMVQHESNHSQMESMHDLGERVSVEIFREIDDFTS